MARIISIVVGFFLFCAPFSVQAGLFDDLIDKANKLVKIERYQEAHALIEKAILNHPDDPSIHYRAGLAYARMGRNWKRYVDASFDNVYRTRPNKYLVKVSAYYKNMAYMALKGGDANQAIRQFRRSFLFDPAVKGKTIKDLFSLGKDYFSQQMYDNAYNNLRAAYFLDNSLGDQISDIYFDACKKSDKPCFNLYRRAHEFSRKHDDEIVKALMGLYRSKVTAPHQKADIKKEVKFYVSNQTFKKLFPPPPPDFKIYPPGTYTFTLKAGETTDHWIMFPYGRTNHYSLSSADEKYQILYSEGDQYNCWETEKLPHKTRAKFKIKAITDQKIKLVVK